MISSFCSGGDCVDVEVTSSACHSGGCVGVTPSVDGVVVRNTKDSAYRLRFTANEWSAFVQGVKAGEFDFGLTAS